MKSNLQYVLLAAIMVVSCTSEQRKKLRERRTTIHPFIFNMEHYFSDSELQLSFPVWFDDSIVVEKRIKKITRKVFANPADEEDDLPREIKVYDFNERGSLTTVSIKKFYENMVVEDVTFSYSGVKDKVGFASVEILNGAHHTEQGSEYVVHSKEKYHDKFLVYVNENSGDYLFFMLNENHWGPLSVDSILRPTPDDVIVLGTPRKPRKKYQVHNTVSESNVVELEYRNNGEVVKSISFEKYPFYYKRSITYNNKGYCIGYIDSTFSSNDYLTRTLSNFELNEVQLPVKLTHTKPGGGGYELFEYEYYEN